MEIFVAIVPFAAVVAIAVWSGIHTYRLARPTPAGPHDPGESA